MEIIEKQIEIQKVVIVILNKIDDPKKNYTIYKQKLKI
jgi:hypothetical protein